VHHGLDTAQGVDIELIANYAYDIVLVASEGLDES
jgi:hypothetical protein